MTLVSASELAAIQAVAESGMNTAVYIQRPVTDTNNENGWVTTYVEDGTPVLGWLFEFTPGGATIGVIAGAMGLSEQIWLRLPIGTNVSSGDRARIGSNVFTIEHTNEDSTYRPWIACAVRIIV